MKTNIFIPEKINVGFQNREDTYTKKLAYIIYFDQKGELRKESSWKSWRDEKIPNQIFENTPTSGFVLNKKAGGYDTGWNHRQTYCRVYDPRDFEFEITIPNLLYILENTNSIKGKGLEGEFVYGWDGKDLVLIPVDSPDYKEISEFNLLIHAKNYVKTKDLILGAKYKTKDNKEYIYMGRFDYWKVESERVKNDCWRNSYNYIYKDVNKGKYYYFVNETINWYNEPYLETIQLKSLGDKIIECTSNECVQNYSDLFDKLESTAEYSPHDKSKDKFILYTFEEFCEKIEKRWFYCFNSSGEEVEIQKEWDNPNKIQVKDRKNWSNKINGTREEIFNKIKPQYKNEYLINGKFYRRVN